MVTEPKIIVTGKGTSGSWQIRGEQLGTAIGADVVPMGCDWSGYDLIICVKRVVPDIASALATRKVPLVWDIVDAWPQGEGNNGNNWGKDKAIEWLHKSIVAIAPDAIVFPTTSMRIDSEWQGPCIVLPHHAWPKYKPAKIRQMVQTVGYEGGDQYLGKWRQIVTTECERRGWFFSPNSNMAYNDVVVAVRDCKGYPARHWKSNCKLANIQALGLPAICSVEDSYLEFGSGEEIFVVDRLTLSNAFDALVPYAERVKMSEIMERSTPRLSDISQEYLSWLKQLKS